MWVKNILGDFAKHSLSQNKYSFHLYEFLKRRTHALVGKVGKKAL